jgi:pyruvate carboxylase
MAVQNLNYKSDKPRHKKATAESHVGSPLQGRIAEVRVEEGQKIKDGDALFVIEAMKMESTVNATRDGKVRSVHIEAGEMVEQDDLVIELE